LKLLSFGYMQ